MFSKASSRSLDNSVIADMEPPSRSCICFFNERFSLELLASVSLKDSASDFAVSRVISRESIAFAFASMSRRRDKISETREACKVGVNRRGSRGEIVSSFAASIGLTGPSDSYRLSELKRGGEEEGPGDESLRWSDGRRDIGFEGVR
ncbi:hypothetical protein ACKS0A_06996 [Histoplasma ohiense]